MRDFRQNGKTIPADPHALPEVRLAFLAVWFFLSVSVVNWWLTSILILAIGEKAAARIPDSLVQVWGASI